MQIGNIMISQLAIEDINQMKAEGIDVQPEDIIRLNALGLKITENPECELAVMPRVASLEGVQFRQPSIAKDMLLDECYRLFSKDESTTLGYEAYILSHDVDEDILKHPVKFAFKVTWWFRKHFKNTTAAQVRRVVDYCLYGVDETTGEFPIMMVDSKADVGNDKIGSDKSWALASYLAATSTGIPNEAALRATSPQLAAMIERAYILRGMPLNKNENSATSEYYSTLQAIRAKYTKEQKDNG